MFEANAHARNVDSQFGESKRGSPPKDPELNEYFDPLNMSRRQLNCLSPYGGFNDFVKNFNVQRPRIDEARQGFEC